ncbi:hypothetical protein GCM10023187_12410 [Nibrella viscosa]|uniref:Transcriptional regulator n=1 Tax=Nibrella viscosa TaxID=1084524 RepID=A0ABP8K367_9BACT
MKKAEMQILKALKEFTSLTFAKMSEKTGLHRIVCEKRCKEGPLRQYLTIKPYATRGDTDSVVCLNPEGEKFAVELGL